MCRAIVSVYESGRLLIGFSHKFMLLEVVYYGSSGNYVEDKAPTIRDFREPELEIPVEFSEEGAKKLYEDLIDALDYFADYLENNDNITSEVSDERRVYVAVPSRVPEEFVTTIQKLADDVHVESDYEHCPYCEFKMTDGEGEFSGSMICEYCGMVMGKESIPVYRGFLKLVGDKVSTMAWAEFRQKMWEDHMDEVLFQDSLMLEDDEGYRSLITPDSRDDYYDVWP